MTSNLKYLTGQNWSYSATNMAITSSNRSLRLFWQGETNSCGGGISASVFQSCFQHAFVLAGVSGDPSDSSQEAVKLGGSLPYHDVRPSPLLPGSHGTVRGEWPLTIPRLKPSFRL
jgi:hypothetical protein